MEATAETILSSHPPGALPELSSKAEHEHFLLLPVRMQVPYPKSCLRPRVEDGKPVSLRSFSDHNGIVENSFPYPSTQLEYCR
jgi:hypothetical protein